MKMKRKSYEPFLFILPALTFLLTVKIYPLFYLADLSLRKASFLQPPMPYIGLKNFQEVISSDQFLNSIYNTFIWTTGSLVLTALLGLITALVFNEKFKGRGFFRVIILLPWIFPYVAAAIIWRFLLTPPFGYFHAFLINWGLLPGGKGALDSSNTAMMFAVLVNSWKHFPFIMLMLLSGLQGIPQRLYDAARVDGATYIQQLRHVTIPLLKPILFVSLLIFTIWAINAFSIVYLLTGGGPGAATETITMYIYRLSFIGFDFGLAAAASVILFGIGLFFSLCYIYRMREELK
jgi:ABC-type sugar transport system permease subunit